jgi:hypothetical protein
MKEFNLSENYDMDEGIVYHEEDIKEFIRLLKKAFTDSADKTDIWDNERYNDFKKTFIKKVNELAGDKLI